MNMRDTPIPAEPVLVLLALEMVWRGATRRLYELRQLEDFHAGGTFENVRYRFEEHTCPVNIRRESKGFFLEMSPTDYNNDPHGIWEVVGWITAKEAEEEFDIKPGSERNGLGLVKAVTERFKEPPEDWQVELDMVPEPAGSMHMRFLQALEDRVITIYNEGGQSAKDEVRDQIDCDRLELFNNQALSITDRADVLLEMAMVLKVDLNFMRLADYKAVLPEPCKDKP